MKKFLSKFTKASRNSEKGFTLIELLIVIAVLGILAAVIIPNVSGFILSGKVAAANSEVASLQTAIQAYTAENNGAYPSGDAAAFAAGVAPYVSTAPKGEYTCGDTGVLTGTDDSYATGIVWDGVAQQWKRG